MLNLRPRLSPAATAAALGALLAMACTTGTPATRPPPGTPPAAEQPGVAASATIPAPGDEGSPVVIVSPPAADQQPRTAADRITTADQQQSRTAAGHTTTAITPPRWIGTRILPRRPDGFGERQPTPRKLRDRRFVTTDLLPPPPDDRWRASIRRLPAGVLKRSTWHDGCPVRPRELRYVTMTFWGFDDLPHTGEMVVNALVADDVVTVFRRMYRARFPIEEMRVRRAGEIDLPPTGDGNNTESFDCRNATLRGSWSNHAYGVAVDINPFHNPYRKGDLVVPELAEAYLDRTHHRPGMIQPGDVVTRAFADIGWGWGGAWATVDDWQHFSANGH